MATKRRCCLALLLLGLAPLLGQEHAEPRKDDPYASGDPFAELPGTKVVTVEYRRLGPLLNTVKGPEPDSIQDRLESYGIPFPKGTSAEPLSGEWMLRVTQTVENVELIDAVIGSVGDPPEKSVLIEIQVFEMPSEDAEKVVGLVRDGESDHSDASGLANQMFADGVAKQSANLRLIAQSGQRQRVESGSKVSFVEDLRWDEKQGRLSPVFAIRKAGTILEAEPVIDPKDFSVHLSYRFQHDYRPPKTENMEIKLGEEEIQSLPMTQFFVDEVVAQLMLKNGHKALIGRFKNALDEGETKERLVFLSVLVQEIEEQAIRRTINENPEVEESE